ncbi:MAG: hypothetical protein ACLTZM_08225 [Ruminococcus sp.]
MEFERCIDFLVRMIDKYGDEVLRDTSRDTSRHISRYAFGTFCRSYIDGKKTQRYNKKKFTVFSLLKWREHEI